ncbi:uracil-xanthine permease family protein [Crossiella sp. CA198]|uniref:uracil-xanthine permease family protein n=1 Tax=Crossiella sp. CA198 TaxID=3455607 RepID=UPI003F8CF4EF
MALWALHGDGRRVQDGAMVAPEERLNWFLTIGFGVQHVMVMFAATMLVPLLTGFPPTTTLFFSGLGTLLFLLITRNRMPSYLGSSFAFLAPLTAAMQQNVSMAARVGAVLVAGALMLVIGIAVKALGARLLESLMPPVVTGAVVIIIGLNLARNAVQQFEKQSGLAVVTFLVILFVGVVLRGTLSRTAVLVGVLVGWLLAAFNGELDPIRLREVLSAPWFGLPAFQTPEIRPALVIAVLPAVVVLIAENVGHLKAVAAVTGRDLDGSAGDVLIGNGLATVLAGTGGGVGTTTYAENIGVMTATRVYSTAAHVVAALVAIMLSFSPKLGAMINTVPPGVISGASLMLYGMIGLVGIRIWLDARIDLSDPVNLMVGGGALVAGIGDLTLSVGDVPLAGIAWGTIIIVVLHPLLRWLRSLTHGTARAQAAGRGPRGREPGNRDQDGQQPGERESDGGKA